MHIYLFAIFNYPALNKISWKKTGNIKINYCPSPASYPEAGLFNVLSVYLTTAKLLKNDFTVYKITRIIFVNTFLNILNGVTAAVFPFTVPDAP